ncbi:hypothetical protein [Okeania sp. SIO1I7]|nr:hypothetical protein [Okeania sp. SIO1I7]
MSWQDKDFATDARMINLILHSVKHQKNRQDIPLASAKKSW